jgi:hypothetical protein
MEAPAVFEAKSRAALIEPSRAGGVQTTISRHPATLARTIVIKAVETSGAAPPGM